MRLRTALLVACLGALAAPAGATADPPPSGTADLAVSVTVQRPGAGGWQTVADPAAPIDIGDTVHVTAAVTNAGPDPASVRLTLSDLLGVGGGGNTKWLGNGAGPGTCEVQSLATWCTFSVMPGGEWDYEASVTGRLPGVAGITFTATAAQADPDPSNNQASWRAPVACQVTGTPGDDTLVAGPGQAACGLGGNDTLIAEPGALALSGGEGDDTFEVGRATGMQVEGGPGIDTATYADARNPVMVCPAGFDQGLFSGGMDSPEDGDATMWGVENIVGSPFDDRLLGDGVANTLTGGGGNDWIGGGPGDDVLRGGPGADLFASADGAHDSINGGIGGDRAHVDRGDHVVSARDVTANPFHDPCQG